MVVVCKFGYICDCQNERLIVRTTEQKEMYMEYSMECMILGCILVAFMATVFVLIRDFDL